MCKRRRTKEGHDPCIANLPGVEYACCGHGVCEGYAMFINGIVLKGAFYKKQEQDNGNVSNITMP